jgi:hypothetical protein
MSFPGQRRLTIIPYHLGLLIGSFKLFAVFIVKVVPEQIKNAPLPIIYLFELMQTFPDQSV